MHLFEHFFYLHYEFLNYYLSLFARYAEIIKAVTIPFYICADFKFDVMGYKIYKIIVVKLYKIIVISIRSFKIAINFCWVIFIIKIFYIIKQF